MDATETAVIEIRIRRQGDARKWENIPAGTAHPRSVHRLIQSLEQLATEPDIDTIRWNHAGSLQGHYIIRRSPATEEA